MATTRKKLTTTSELLRDGRAVDAAVARAVRRAVKGQASSKRTKTVAPRAATGGRKRRAA